MEELTVLVEYFDSLGLNRTKLTREDLVNLKNELKEAGEFGLARLVESLEDPQDLLDYIGGEEL